MKDNYMELLDKLNTIIGANRKILNEADIPKGEQPSKELEVPEDEESKNKLIKNVPYKKFYNTKQSSRLGTKVSKDFNVDDENIGKFINILNSFKNIKNLSQSQKISLLQLGKQIELLPQNITAFEGGYNYERLLAGLIGISNARPSGEEGEPHDIKDEKRGIHYSIKITFRDRNPDFNISSFIENYFIKNNKSIFVFDEKSNYSKKQLMTRFIEWYNKQSNKMSSLKALLSNPQNNLEQFYLIIFYFEKKEDKEGEYVDAFKIKVFDLDEILGIIINSLNNGRFYKTSTFASNNVVDIKNLRKILTDTEQNISDQNKEIREQLYNAIKLSSSIDDFLTSLDPASLKRSKPSAEKAVRESKLLEWQITKLYKEHIISNKQKQ